MAVGGKIVWDRVVCMLVLLNSFMVYGQKQQSTVVADGSNNVSDDFFISLFNNKPGVFDSVLLHRIGWNVQLLYTKIDQARNGSVVLEKHYFNKKDAAYFYPSTAIKLPLAILALQKLHELPFPGIDINTSMITGAFYSGQTPQYNDPNAPDGRPTIGRYIQEMMLANDLNAMDRLYEFLGQEYINKQLLAKGYKSVQILHRPGNNLSDDENRHTNPVSFYNRGIRTALFTQPMQYSEMRFGPRNDFIGKGYMNDTILVSSPMNFSAMNRISLDDLNTMMIALLFPEKCRVEERFNITDADRKFLLKYMSQLPGESGYPGFDTAAVDISPKYLFYGNDKKEIAGNPRIFNVTGMEYGQLTDIAFIIDTEKKLSFILAATIYCNNDGILNDDHYNYQQTGLPFMKNIGRLVYEYELTRKRNNVPDLSPFLFTYDK